MSLAAQVFKDERSAPVAVSLDEMLACRSLLGALQACMRAKQNRMPQVAQPAAQLLGGHTLPAFIWSPLYDPIICVLQ